MVSREGLLAVKIEGGRCVKACRQQEVECPEEKESP
jgi:hypothetical protein